MRCVLSSPRCTRKAGHDGVAEATRRALIHDAEAASDHGDHVQAIALAVRAVQVRATPSLRMFLAGEYAEVRDWLHAYVHGLTRSVSARRALAAVPHRHTILSSCEQVEREASPHIGWLVLRVPADAQGLAVRVAGVELAARAAPGRAILSPRAPSRSPRTTRAGVMSRSRCMLPRGSRRR